MTDAEETARAFKTAWFAKAARKARIKDDELCEAIQDVMKGQADNLGGGVFKKRLNKKHASEHHSREGWPILGLRLSLREEGSGKYRR